MCRKIVTLRQNKDFGSEFILNGFMMAQTFLCCVLLELEWFPPYYLICMNASSKKTVAFDPGVISESVRKFSNDSFCSFEWIAAAKVEQSKNWKIYLSLFESCFHFMELKKQRQKIFI